jgi:hypothetical protein
VYTAVKSWEGLASCAEDAAAAQAEAAKRRDEAGDDASAGDTFEVVAEMSLDEILEVRGGH